MAAGALMTLLCAPLFLAWQPDDAPLFEVAREEPGMLAIAILVLGLPLLVGVMSVRLGLSGRPPGKVVFGVFAVVQALMATGLVVLTMAAAMSQRDVRENPGTWLSALAGGAAVFTLVRGFFRAGWERWARLLAGGWLLGVQVSMVLILADRSILASPGPGAWIVLFALAAMTPILVPTLRRAARP
jgi:hypothetical protein